MSYLCMIMKGVWENVRLGPHIDIKGRGLTRGTNRWCAICYNGRENNGWFMVCMGDGVDSRFMVAHDKSNGQ